MKISFETSRGSKLIFELRFETIVSDVDLL